VQRPLIILAAGIAAIAVAAPAGAGNNVSVTIRHQTAGCHAWAIGLGTYAAFHSLKVAPGTALTFTNNDVMPQTLKQLAGPVVTMRNIASSMPMGMGLHGPFAAGTMARMGAGTRIVLTKPGTYRFTTRAGEDYMQGMKTTGEDNVLKLVVVVK